MTDPVVHTQYTVTRPLSRDPFLEFVAMVMDRWAVAQPIVPSLGDPITTAVELRGNHFDSTTAADLVNPLAAPATPPQRADVPTGVRPQQTVILIFAVPLVPIVHWKPEQPIGTLTISGVPNSPDVSVVARVNEGWSVVEEKLQQLWLGARGMQLG